MQEKEGAKDRKRSTSEEREQTRQTGQTRTNRVNNNAISQEIKKYKTREREDAFTGSRRGRFGRAEGEDSSTSLHRGESSCRPCRGRRRPVVQRLQWWCPSWSPEQRPERHRSSTPFRWTRGLRCQEQRRREYKGTLFPWPEGQQQQQQRTGCGAGECGGEDVVVVDAGDGGGRAGRSKLAAVLVPVAGTSPAGRVRRGWLVRESGTEASLRSAEDGTCVSGADTSVWAWASGQPWGRPWPLACSSPVSAHSRS